MVQIKQVQLQIPGVTSERLVDLDANTFLERVPIHLMFVAPYQRPIGSTQIARMLKHGFDERKLGIITLSLRDSGQYAILDGHHRRVIAQGHGLTELVARVFIDLTYEEEAQLFEALNTIKAPGALDKYRARIEYNEPLALAIRAELAKYDMRVGGGGNRNPHTVSCVGALDILYQERGPLQFAEVLNVIHQAWGREDPLAWTGKIVAGMRMFWARYRDDIEFPRLVAQLQKHTPQSLLTAAGANPVSSDSIPALVGRQIAMVYTGRYKSARYNLPPWTNYVKGTGEGPDSNRYTAEKLIASVRGEKMKSRYKSKSQKTHES